MQVEAESFHLNGHIIRFRPQTQKLESPYKTPSSTPAVKGLIQKVRETARSRLPHEDSKDREWKHRGLRKWAFRPLLRIHFEFWQQGKINVPVVINIVILIGAREDICIQLSQGTLLAAKSRICPTRLAKTSGIG